MCAPTYRWSLRTARTNNFFGFRQSALLRANCAEQIEGYRFVRRYSQDRGEFSFRFSGAVAGN